jgi:GNAT superfamily N-acetyltransferase
MTVPFKLRRYDQGDLDELHALVVHAIRSSYPEHYPPRAVQFFVEHHAREKIATDGAAGFVIIAVSGDRIIGTATLARDTVARVFVAPELQGSGIGRALMDRIEAEARSLGLNRLVLDASLPALRFYQSRGYHTRSEKAIDVGEGQELRYYEMEMSL